MHPPLMILIITQSFSITVEVVVTVIIQLLKFYPPFCPKGLSPLDQQTSHELGITKLQRMFILEFLVNLENIFTLNICNKGWWFPKTQQGDNGKSRLLRSG